MVKTIVQTHAAPSPIGPYSQAVRFGDILFLSGQIALNPETGNLTESAIEVQTRQVMENLKAVLMEAGMDFSHVIKSTIFLTDLQDFPEVNTVYGAYFEDKFPARETIEVSGLPKGADVEISMIAGY